MRVSDAVGDLGNHETIKERNGLAHRYRPILMSRYPLESAAARAMPPVE